MKNILCVFWSLFFFYSYSQNIKNTQKSILDRYDNIDINAAEASSVDEIKELTAQSQNINFQQGVLRGKTLLQKAALIANDYVLSGKYGDEAEMLADQLNDYAALSAVYLYRGKINIILDQYPEAETKLNKSIFFAEKIKNKADRHIQLCRIYANFAGIYEGLGKSKEWGDATKKSLASIETTPTENLTEYQQSKYYYLYIFELMNMGNFYSYSLKPPKPELAEPYFKRVVEFEKTAPEYFKIMNIDVYESVSGFYIVKKEYQNAIDYSQKLLDAEKLKSSPRDRLFAYRNMKDSYKSLNNTSEENKYLRLYSALNDSINFSEKKTIVSQSRDQIKSSDIRNQESKKLLLLIGAVVILFITFGSWFFIQRNKKILRRNYEQVIINLKNEPAVQPLETDNIDNEIEDETNDESEISANKNVISADTEARILRRLSYLEKSEKFLRKDFTISLLATQLNTNSKYLSEIIKNRKFQNFNNYINSLRISYIVHKLYNEPKYREYKISYLAEECGYASPQVFVLAFKKINGVTPSYFIHSLKEDQNLV